MFDLFAYFKFYLGITPISQCRLFHRSYRPCVSFSMMKVGIKRLQYIPSEAALYINVETQWEIESYCSIPRTQEKSYSDEMNTHATHKCTMFHSASLRQYYKMCSKVIHFHFMTEKTDLCSHQHWAMRLKRAWRKGCIMTFLSPRNLCLCGLFSP